MLLRAKYGLEAGIPARRRLAIAQHFLPNGLGAFFARREAMWRSRPASQEESGDEAA
jgi:hypothetical protein